MKRTKIVKVVILVSKHQVLEIRRLNSGKSLEVLTVPLWDAFVPTGWEAEWTFEPRDMMTYRRTFVPVGYQISAVHACAAT